MSVAGVVGVSDHGGWAVLVTAGQGGIVLDRRRVELVDEGLPKIPLHSKGQLLPLDEITELIDQVRTSARRHAKLVLGELASAVPGPIVGIALRQCPELPPTIAEQITDYRACNVADWVMYRKALAAAAEARGWSVYWYDRRQVEAVASKALGINNLDAHFTKLRRSLGPPWGQDHKIALAAAIAAISTPQNRAR